MGAEIPATIPPGPTDDCAFPIVGIGASAGGLEALELFLRHLPDKCGMAFVVIQHLAPTDRGMMVELLQRSTSMRVAEVKDRVKVEPDRVYVIPPNKDLSILHGTLHLLVPTAPRGLRLPIDFFLRSLADDQKDRSIGVILSGMGSDGTLGLRAIREKAGVTFAQAPESAKFDGMPRSAISAGLVDVVAPVEELARKVVSYRTLASRAVQPGRPLSDEDQSAIEKVCVLLRNQTGRDFSLYRRNAVCRRIERRMALHQIESVAGYVRHLQDSPQEAELLLKELLIGVTSFFRDPVAWEHLRNKAIPALLATRPAAGTLRAWVPGCSTGEEAYSLAIAFMEAFAQERPSRSCSLQIFATDLDQDAVEKARQGVYSGNIADDVSVERLHRFFVKDERGYRVGKDVRRAVTFASHNLIMDPPFTKLDVLSCRNLLIYLEPELQKRLVSLFHYSLRTDGILFLGSAETIGTATDLLIPLHGNSRIYRKASATSCVEAVELPAFFPSPPRQLEAPSAQSSAHQRAPSIQTLSDQLLLMRYSPAAVLTNDKGDILYVSGRTGRFLEPAAGKANWNIHAMAREGLRRELLAAFQKAVQDAVPVTRRCVCARSDAEMHAVDITVDPIQEPQGLRSMVMIVFAEVAPGHDLKSQAHAATATAQPPVLARAMRELRETRDELQSTREEMQGSQEELRSANEELQSTNEELQSSNEELTTSREEMQSLNEELQTLNHELQTKVDELSHANNDMRHLLDSTDIATLFLDDDLNVRRFTAQMAKIIKLRPNDVGRPLADLASDLDYPDLGTDTREVLQTLVVKEKPISTHDGRWFSARVMPYRTPDNQVDGVVITFSDITVAKKLEAMLRQTQGPEKARR